MSRPNHLQPRVVKLSSSRHHTPTQGRVVRLSGRIPNQNIFQKNDVPIPGSLVQRSKIQGSLPIPVNLAPNLQPIVYTSKIIPANFEESKIENPLEVVSLCDSSLGSDASGRRDFESLANVSIFCLVYSFL